jgi:hypothetical protein
VENREKVASGVERDDRELAPPREGRSGGFEPGRLFETNRSRNQPDFERRFLVRLVKRCYR